MDERPLTVSALTQRIADDLEAFGPVAVEGELTQVKVAPSGHLYATLKDAAAAIALVMWRSTVLRQGPLPKEGERVVARGALSVYAPRGAYQIVATRIAPLGAGDILARVQRLKEKLAAEGLFEDERKRPLPALPRAVGLATAAGSAALADLLHAIRERFPAMPVVHAPCLVQGPEAPASIAAALARLGRHPQVDVVICGRGGGSLDDLMAFNDERVVRAIAACPAPVVSAVGHETDWTLADLVADLRAKTPTAAAELAVPAAAELAERIAQWRGRLDRAIDRGLDAALARWRGWAAHRALAGPQHQVAMRRQRLDELAERMEAAVDAGMAAAGQRRQVLAGRLAAQDPGRRVAERGARLAELAPRLERATARHRDAAALRLAQAAARLEALSPVAVIARGYAALRDADGRIVRHRDQAPPGAAIAARVADGWLDATVTGTRPLRAGETGF